METNIIFIFISLVCIVLVGYLIWLDNRNMRMLKFRVQKMQASPMFKEMIPLLKMAQKRAIEHLIIDKTGVVIQYLATGEMETCFLMSEHGYPYLSPERQEALLILLEEVLPKLSDAHRYSLQKKRVTLINGQHEFYYQYIIANHYKMSLIRAPQYDGTLRELWQ